MDKPIVEVKLADEELDILSKGGPEFGPRLSTVLAQEVIRFETWMVENLKGGLSAIERAAVKTYLYSKIVGRVDNLPTKKMEEPFDIGITPLAASK